MLAVTLIGFALVGVVFRFFGRKSGGRVSLAAAVSGS
jgi:hypothetical protein